MEDFLQEGAAAAIDIWQNIEVMLDGATLDLEGYRFQTDLFYITGTPELSNSLDPCITGDPQPPDLDGYHIMLKKLSPFEHVLTIGPEIPDAYSFLNTFIIPALTEHCLRD